MTKEWVRTQQVECFVFKKINEKFLFLLLKRIPKKGHFWQPPCGGVEKDDLSLLDAVYREINEETAIAKDKIIRVIPDVHSFVISADYLSDKEITPITEYVYGIEVKEDTQADISKNIYPEHEEVRWVDFESALQMLKWPNNKDGLTKLHDILENELKHHM